MALTRDGLPWYCYQRNQRCDDISCNSPARSAIYITPTRIWSVLVGIHIAGLNRKFWSEAGCVLELGGKYEPGTHGI